MRLQQRVSLVRSSLHSSQTSKMKLMSLETVCICGPGQTHVEGVMFPQMVESFSARTRRIVTTATYWVLLCVHSFLYTTQHHHTVRWQGWSSSPPVPEEETEAQNSSPRPHSQSVVFQPTLLEPLLFLLSFPASVLCDLVK